MDVTEQRARRRQPNERPLALALALALDRVFGEPPSALHPVVGLGNLVAVLERRAPPSRGPFEIAYGCGLVVAVVGVAVGLATLAERFVERLPLVPRLLARAALLKPAFAVRELLAAGERVRDPLARGDVPTARAALR
ncbi:MAG: cobalamin biosynthesis protein, partial [Chloroflexota bacterium]|nr:cobalamin biosynthesis protein [Chloroflexota bacterium]